MATAYSLASMSNGNTILQRPIDLSFDLDEALTLTMNRSTSAPEDLGHGKIKDLKTDSDLVITSLATVATDGVCSVCMDDFQTAFPGEKVPCGHVFHATCIAKWIALCDSCPLCRSRCIIFGDD